MLSIPCPWCGDRDEPEFRYGGESHIEFPSDPDSISDEAWRDFVFVRGNPRGELRERWVHTQGCRRWFNVIRDTATHEIQGSYRMGETGPAQAGSSEPAA